jgi:hypothetical protein
MVSIIVGTAVAGLFLMATVLFMTRGMTWRSYEFSFGREVETPGETLARYVQHPASWALGFFLLIFSVGVVALAALGALPIPVPGGLAAVGIIVGLLAFVATVFGTYSFVRSRDRSTAEAVVMSLLVFGVVFVLFLSANLIFGLLGG